MLLLGRLVPFSPISKSGARKKRRQKPEGRNGSRDLLSHLAAGTSLFLSIRVSGKSAPHQALCSKCGQGHAGSGSKSALLAPQYLLMWRWEVLPLLDVGASGGCTRLWKNHSR